MFPIFKASRNKEAAWAFAKFMTTKNVSYYISSHGNTLPLRRSVARMHGILDAGPKGSHYVYDILPRATVTPSPSKGSIIQTDLENTFAQILAGNVDIAKALRQLNQRMQSNL